MKLPITIEYMSRESETYTVQPPEWAKWEQKTGSTISQAQEKIGMADLLFLCLSCNEEGSRWQACQNFGDMERDSR
jgi:hypothetical protein